MRQTVSPIVVCDVWRSCSAGGGSEDDGMKSWMWICGLAAATAPSLAAAGYLGDRATWDRLDAGAKAAYAMGVMDAANILYDSDPASEAAVKRGRVRCLADLRLPPERLAALVDASYARKADNPPRPPSVTLIAEVSAMCQRQIEAERASPSQP